LPAALLLLPLLLLWPLLLLFMLLPGWMMRLLNISELQRALRAPRISRRMTRLAAGPNKIKETEN
jgi:hypothetical protein